MILNFLMIIQICNITCTIQDEEEGWIKISKNRINWGKREKWENTYINRRKFCCTLLS